MFTPESGSVARTIERQLRKEIVSLVLLPGVKLSEQDIAARFGVSRQPVREALIALAKAELVAILPQRGTIVVKISGERMMQARFIREQLEVGVVRRACEIAISERDMQSLQDIIDTQSAAFERGNAAALKESDELFHLELARVARLEMASTALIDIKSHLERVCHLTTVDIASMQPLIQQHQAILDAIRQRDADAAEAAMRFHLTEILRVLPNVMALRSELFDGYPLTF
ncbi:MAG: GntR family transcriptional regulator [Beijerinckiaceae bacterium]